MAFWNDPLALLRSANLANRDAADLDRTGAPLLARVRRQDGRVLRARATSLLRK